MNRDVVSECWVASIAYGMVYNVELLDREEARGVVIGQVWETWAELGCVRGLLSVCRSQCPVSGME